MSFSSSPSNQIGGTGIGAIDSSCAGTGGTDTGVITPALALANHAVKTLAVITGLSRQDISVV